MHKGNLEKSKNPQYHHRGIVLKDSYQMLHFPNVCTVSVDINPKNWTLSVKGYWIKNSKSLQNSPLSQNVTRIQGDMIATVTVF